jgi:hypothetical protein
VNKEVAAVSLGMQSSIGRGSVVCKPARAHRARRTEVHDTYKIRRPTRRCLRGSSCVFACKNLIFACNSAEAADHRGPARPGTKRIERMRARALKPSMPSFIDLGLPNRSITGTWRNGRGSGSLEIRRR